VGEQEVGVETLMERMKRLSEKSESYQITQEELSKRFETVETQSAELAAAPQRMSAVLDSDIGLFIEDPAFIYQDFAKVIDLECRVPITQSVAPGHALTCRFFFVTYVARPVKRHPDVPRAGLFLGRSRLFAG
jgi:hypothetical protein